MTALPNHHLAKDYADVPPALVARLQQFRSGCPKRQAMVAGTLWHYLDCGSSGETPLLLLTGAACFADMS